jgi:hypothetical protein
MLDRHLKVMREVVVAGRAVPLEPPARLLASSQTILAVVMADSPAIPVTRVD